MTIGVGFLCTDGLILAGDTCIITSDGKKQSGPKIGTAHSASGSYAIVNAADDGNAANTLAVKILKDLGTNNYATFDDVETLVAAYMTRWWAAFAKQKPPGIQLILGAVMNGVPRLYFCEPPNTVYQQREYIGIGSGASTTDPLVATLFPGYDVTAEVRLWHIAYLFYRAKKDDAFCGGETTPVHLALDGSFPRYVASWEMHAAEKLGPQFDLYLREILKTRLTTESDEKMKESMQNLAQIMTLSSKELDAISLLPPLGGGPLKK